MPSEVHTSAPKFLVETFGCQMNVHDSQRMEDALRAAGWVPATDERDADLIVLNTCSVREKAEHKLRSEAGRLKPLKRERPGLVVAVAGCVAQQEGEALLTRIPHLDIVIGPDNLAELPALAEAARMGSPPVARTVFDLEMPMFLTSTRTPSAEQGGRVTPVSAFVTTMKGCDERCSFCVVPYTRGPERYRPMGEIVDEVRTLVDRGAGEITLLGQTVNSWLPPDGDANDDSDRSAFASLLRAIVRDVPNLQRLRYTSPHPRHVTPELVAAHAELDVLAKHVHLPSQSGSDRLLKRMIRRYTRAELVERARLLQNSRPGTTLSTDIIVGFPGETADDFEATLSMIREVGFVSLFGFKFSPRPNTPALKLRDDVSDAEKQARLERLFEVTDTLQRAHLATLLGTRCRVLVEGASRGSEAKARLGEATRMTGRSERNELVHLDVPLGRDGTPLIGRFFDAEITAVNAHSLVGSLESAVLETLETLAPLALRTSSAAASEASAPRRLPMLSVG